MRFGNVMHDAIGNDRRERCVRVRKVLCIPAFEDNPVRRTRPLHVVPPHPKHVFRPIDGGHAGGGMLPAKFNRDLSRSGRDVENRIRAGPDRVEVRNENPVDALLIHFIVIASFLS
jgi:hypothetical protein